jgi:hypothetical protein
MRQATIRWRSKAVAELQLKLVSVGILQNAKFAQDNHQTRVASHSVK